jgi:hypothetical protein
MKNHLASLCQLVALTLFLCCLFAVTAAAQDSSVNHENARPRFVVIPPKPAAPDSPLPSGTLMEWNGSFTHNGT